MGKIALDAELGRELLMFGILGPVVQGEGLTTACRQLLEAVTDRLIRLSCTPPGKLCDQDKPALALGQCV